MRAAPLLLSLALAGCASAPPGEIADPFEPINRRVHGFNKSLDAAVLRPVSQALASGQPAEGPGAVEMIGNFGANLALPGKVVNSLLQGRPEPAARNMFRFMVNSTLGIGGLFDLATEDFDLPEVDTDFGETLHVWGVPAGAYLELPVLGPSTQRDLVGDIVDVLLIDPLDGVVHRDVRRAGLAARVLSKAGERAQFGSTLDSVLHESADSYAQTRLLYMQHRQYELNEEGEVIDPYSDE